ncbi:palmitoyl-acyl carrier protein thioesterase, chloroplastic-like [Gastrolobium bilobum]|uniref:palmitoyl-acyl carrier protein thioesterase, chloroplastic-like n=1 Tax=Gastrolobium bilobum TaxID=150636 RepID=UPI002AAF8DC0|nr:palmitoyl-acyl carrier protein thioesterase, chloroplastic-like [Gastrolobium bilobum]
MAAISNIGLQFPRNLSNAKKENVVTKGEVLWLSFYSSRNTNKSNNEKRRFSLVTASYNDNSPGKVDTINGTKVNGTHVAEVHLSAGKLANESAVDAALVNSLHGRFVEGKLVYRQIFAIRSYEIGPDKTATMETLMNFLQETALNHVNSSGIGGDGFGATRQMSLRKLIWVVTRIQVQVQRYSKWGDEIEVHTWVDAAGKNGMRRDWIIRDHYTKEIITKATSTWAIMNRETRRLSKMPDQVKQELSPFYLYNRLAIASEETDCEKINKLTDDNAERIQSGLAPRWNDMDANQHVNNVKYIGWMLESVPTEVLQDYNMTSMTLEFRRECMQSDLLESMTSPTAKVIGESDNNSSNRKPHLQYTHLLRLQDDRSDVLRARTEWHLKQNEQ